MKKLIINIKNYRNINETNIELFTKATNCINIENDFFINFLSFLDIYKQDIKKNLLPSETNFDSNVIFEDQSILMPIVDNYIYSNKEGMIIHETSLERMALLPNLISLTNLENLALFILKKSNIQCSLSNNEIKLISKDDNEQIVFKLFKQIFFSGFSNESLNIFDKKNLDKINNSIYNLFNNKSIIKPKFYPRIIVNGNSNNIHVSFFSFFDSKEIEKNIIEKDQDYYKYLLLVLTNILLTINIKKNYILLFDKYFFNEEELDLVFANFKKMENVFLLSDSKYLEKSNFYKVNNLINTSLGESKKVNFLHCKLSSINDSIIDSQNLITIFEQYLTKISSNFSKMNLINEVISEIKPLVELNAFQITRKFTEEKIFKYYEQMKLLPTLINDFFDYQKEIINSQKILSVSDEKNKKEISSLNENQKKLEYLISELKNKQKKDISEIEILKAKLKECQKNKNDKTNKNDK